MNALSSQLQLRLLHDVYIESTKRDPKIHIYTKHLPSDNITSLPDTHTIPSVLPQPFL